MGLILVDVEAPYGVGAPSVGDMTEFGAVVFKTRESFHGIDCSKETFDRFRDWLNQVSPTDGISRGWKDRPIFVSDNPAYDWQWINFYFWKYYPEMRDPNPFGHSARRIGDFAAGLAGDFQETQYWKKYRVTKHDHNPVNDSLGNAEALATLLELNSRRVRT